MKSLADCKIVWLRRAAIPVLFPIAMIACFLLTLALAMWRAMRAAAEAFVGEFDVYSVGGIRSYGIGVVRTWKGDKRWLPGGKSGPIRAGKEGA